MGFSQKLAGATPQTYPQIMWIRDLVHAQQGFRMTFCD